MSTQEASPVRADTGGSAPATARRILPAVFPRAVRTRAPALAALVTALAFCLGDAAARSFPFGTRTRAVNDLGNQFVPFHTHLWDLLHGRADGSLILNWQSGYGSSFLPDLGTYLAGPFSLLVVLFPRDGIDLAVYVITVSKTAAAAAVMAFLLQTLRRGPWWGAAVLGASYALCGWSVTEASYNPMWLDGLIALPLLCLVGHWAMTGRRRVLGTVLVAVVWIANFYTAYMATLAAGLILIAGLLLTDTPVRQRLTILLRAAVTTVLGIGLAAPLLLVIVLGTTYAYPGTEREFSAARWTDVFARLLPGTYNFMTPAAYLGTAALLLALTLPFHSAVPRRSRHVWTVLPVVVALSMQWGPTHLLWHAFATPNGSPYRQTFVLSGVLVIAAWQSLAHGVPGRRALLRGGGLLALITAAAYSSDLIGDRTLPALLAGAAAVTAALLLAGLADRRHRPLLAAGAAVLLIGAQIGQSAVTTAHVTRERLDRMDDYAGWGERQQRQREAIAEVDDWPRHRTEPGREQSTANDPLVVGGQGAQYYSSLTSDVLSSTLASLGGGWTSGGRAPQSLENPVTDALFSVGARIHSPPDPHQAWNPQGGGAPRVTRQDVPPLVTVRPSGPAPAYGSSAYRNQELLLGAPVYTLPEFPDHRVTGGVTSVLTVTCPVAAREVFLWAPGYTGSATLRDGTAANFTARLSSMRAAMQPLGTATASGGVEIELTPLEDGTIPAGAVGCLDRERLDAAVDGLRTSGATSVSTSGSGIRAELPPGTRGTAVIAAPRIAGWQCAAGGAEPAPAGEHLGLIAVPLDGSASSVTCAFRPPGLRLGIATAAAALLALLVPALLLRRRANRTNRRDT